jgi:hypothetical protein
MGNRYFIGVRKEKRSVDYSLEEQKTGQNLLILCPKFNGGRKE